MKINRIIIKGDFAHFKVPASSKIQRTYSIPFVSTVYGILKNIYDENINDFKIGYTLQYKSKDREVMKIYKEFNLATKPEKTKERFKTDICVVEYLYDVELVIYTDIEKEIVLNDVLTLGKANCLATLVSVEKIDLKDIEGYGYNQYTDINIGTGQIRRINTSTKFNENTDRYDIKSSLARENVKFKYDKNYDSDFEQNIHLWNWKDGKISEAN